jgi:hypothetical protein
METVVFPVKGLLRFISGGSAASLQPTTAAAALSGSNRQKSAFLAVASRLPKKPFIYFNIFSASQCQLR